MIILAVLKDELITSTSYAHQLYGWFILEHLTQMGHKNVHAPGIIKTVITPDFHKRDLSWQ